MTRESPAFVCSHVFHDTAPILLVAREQGDWMFLCGARHGKEEQFHVVGAEHLHERDPFLRELMDLPDNSQAERKRVDGIWIRAPLEAE